MVDDQFEIPKLMQRYMGPSFPGYHIAIVMSGADALAFADTAALALVLTDYNMPEMNGVELTKQLRGRFPTLPIVMITAYDTPEIRRDARAAGVTAFIAKPIDFGVLVLQLERYLLKEPQ